MPNNNFIQKEKAMLVGVIHGELDKNKVDQHLDELSLLAETAGGEVIDIVKQKINRINPSFFIGSGKANEIVAVTVGEDKAQETVRKALAVGADRGIHVKVDGIVEPLAVSKILQKIVD